MSFEAEVNGLLHGISILPSDGRADSGNCGFTTVGGLRTIGVKLIFRKIIAYAKKSATHDLKKSA